MKKAKEIEIEERLGKLEWLHEHPPMYKYGDVLKSDDNVVNITVKDNGNFIKFSQAWYRKYMVDTGTQLIGTDEIYLNELERVSSTKK